MRAALSSANGSQGERSQQARDLLAKALRRLAPEPGSGQARWAAVFCAAWALGLSACGGSPTQATSVPPTHTMPPPATETAAPTQPAPALSPTPEPSPTPEVPAPGATRVSEVDQMVQVYVPAGEFLMGSDDIDARRTLENGRAYTEIPVHTVYLDGFWIDKYEVTNGQYARCVEAGVCRAPWSPGSYTRAHYYDRPEYADYPVIWVNWWMAKTYCEWAGRRLPTEAEWEKAARGTDQRRYPWGNDPLTGERANFCDVNCPLPHANPAFDDGFADTAPVGSFPLGASPYGALDMAGNVWEWTSTIVRDYPYDATDGREDPEAQRERVWRGGPWSNGVWWMRSAIRYRSVMFYWYYNLGFRCAASE